MYDYEGDRPGKWEGYGQDYRSLYVGILILVHVAGFILADLIRNQSQQASQEELQSEHQTAGF